MLGGVAGNVQDRGPVLPAGKERGDEGYVIVGLYTVQVGCGTFCVG